MKNKKVSICIPVYNSEAYLDECLRSVGKQTFTDFEVIVVNDGSEGEDEYGYTCKKIVKKASKAYKLDINYIEHKKNKGLLEARRTAIYEAKGQYIFNLDSDDKLPPDAIELLYNTAVETDADIVQGKGELFTVVTDTNVPMIEARLERIRNAKREKISNIYQGVLEGKDIFNGYLVEKNHCGFLWGKLFKRELYLTAFDRIPPMFCTMAEDVIQYFYLTYYAKKYVSIDKCVYLYCDNTGVSSLKIIDTLEKWSQVCSVASVFTALYTTIGELNIELTEEQKSNILDLCCFYVANNLKQLKDTVLSELKEEAYNMMCEYWGEEFVAKIEAELNKRGE